MKTKIKFLITRLLNYNGESKVLDNVISLAKSIQNKWLLERHRAKYLTKIIRMNYKKQDHKV